MEPANENKYPMNWYKFVIYFQLFVAAAVRIWTAKQYFCGDYYGGREMARQVYALWGKLQVLDMAAGILSVALAFYMIVVRQKLYYYKKNVEWYYFAIFPAAMVIDIGYVFAAGRIIGVLVDNTAANLINIAESLVMAILNYIYFRKRKELFVN